MVQARNLNFSYSLEQDIFKNLNFKCEKGQAISILGKSGAGKTTLLRLLASLESPNSGEVINQHTRTGYVFQNNALLNSFSVFENLSLLLEAKQIDFTSQSVIEILNSVGLNGCENLLPDSLSGGMQKRLGVARALIMKPDLLFLDEPTSGLDPVTSRQISALINELSPIGTTTRLTVTSDLFRAQELGQIIYFLENGELTFLGYQNNFRSHPRMKAILNQDGIKTI